MTFIRTRTGHVNTAHIIEARYETDYDGNEILRLFLTDGHTATADMHHEQALAAHIPNHDPALEVWAVFAVPEAPDGIMIERFPLVAWRADGRDLAPVTYEDLDASNFIGEFIHDTRRDTWAIPGARCMPDATAFLDYAYELLDLHERSKTWRRADG